LLSSFKLLPEQLAILWLPRLAYLTLIVGTAFTLSQILWLFIPPPPKPIPSLISESLSKSSISAKSHTPNNRKALENINQAHLFGKPEAPKKTRPISTPFFEPTAPKTQETRLDLELKGIIAADNKQQSLAIIANKKKQENLYAINDRLASGAIVKAIYTDHVLLSIHGRTETLSLPKTSLNLLPSKPVTTPGSPPQIYDEPPMSSSSLSLGETRVTDPKVLTQMSKYRKTLIRNPLELINVVQAQPILDNGQMKGFKIYPGRDKKLFQGTGLKAGDIVKSVNGITLNNMAQGMQIIEQLKEAHDLQLTIDRKGETQSFLFNLEQ
jgi:general secretion pathway protein C